MTEKQKMEEDLKPLREGTNLFTSVAALPFVFCCSNNSVPTTKAIIPVPGPSSVLPQRWVMLRKTNKKKTGALITMALEVANFKETGRMAWCQLWPIFRSGYILDYNGKNEQRTCPMLADRFHAGDRCVGADERFQD
ncbi:hypothetical protein BSKO_09085 [Bryopsis sp. KO-2023]|nr:hypothetical protein BSKO_09085 [Bryopsis sp. KO-2023]